MNLIEAKNIKKIYKLDGDQVETRAVDGISLTVQKGEFLSIMGPSGSGKSTLLQVLGFLDRPTSGEYFFEGKNADEYSEDELAHIRNDKIGFIFQTFNLLRRATVYENVMLPLFYSDIPEAKWEDLVLKALHGVGLIHRKDHSSEKLSGGERQRTAIARALVTDPDIIFADEPTGNLDSVSGEQVMNIIADLNDNKGKTILLITHERYTAEYAQRIINIKDGKIEKEELVEHRNNEHSKFIK